ncbi:MAG: FAD-dependent oxidoreductase, partial [Pseudomonadota bacterium]
MPNGQVGNCAVSARLNPGRSRDMSKQSLVIVGGGYIGVELAQSLSATYAVTLVEPRSAFVHAPAMLRGLVDPGVREQALIPYDRVLKDAKLVAARAVGVTSEGARGTGVALEGGETLPADVIVLSPGASNGGIF